MAADPRVLSGRYRVDAIIGRGGMASVYRGYDVTLGREVAIKILDPTLAADAVFRTRFRMEAQSASRMASPVIVRVFDAGEATEVDSTGVAHPVPFIVMELVAGRLLKDVIAGGVVRLDDAIRYTDGILEALEYSHRAGVVHRDIKPGNVMITDTGQVKVMDFGIARAVSDSSSTVAETTAILGTAAYFSPEQAKGEVVDARTDLYSTGVVLYELLTGRQPFRGDTPVAVAYQHVSEAPVPPSELRQDLPHAFDAVVLRALAKDPFQRFPTAGHFRDALDAARDGRMPARGDVDTLSHTLYGPDPREAAETARSLRQLSADTIVRPTQAGPPAAWIWTGVALLAVVLISILIWVLTVRPANIIPNNSRIVPQVTGMSYSQAARSLAASDLVAKRINETSADTPRGDVIRTDPTSQQSIARNSPVKVYVSRGPDAVAVPKLVGLTLTQAQQELDSGGLTLGQVVRDDDPDTLNDIVTSASPTPGNSVAKGTAVNLIVATGTVAVDNMTQTFTIDQAKQALIALKLSVAVEGDPTCPVTDPNMVTSQSATGEVPIHSRITLVACSGRPGGAKGSPTPSPTP